MAEEDREIILLARLLYAGIACVCAWVGFIALSLSILGIAWLVVAIVVRRAMS